MLNSVIAKRILGKYDYNFSLSGEENIYPIYANNGYGKTNLLKIINSIYNFDESAVEFISNAIFETVELNADNKKLILQKNDIYGREFTITFEGKSFSYEENLKPRWKFAREVENFSKFLGNSFNRLEFLPVNRVDSNLIDSNFSENIRPARGPYRNELDSHRKGLDSVSLTLRELNQEITDNVMWSILSYRQQGSSYDIVLEQFSSTIHNDNLDISIKDIEKIIIKIEKNVHLAEKYVGYLNLGQYFKIKDKIISERLYETNNQNINLLWSILLPFFNDLNSRLESFKLAIDEINKFIANVNSFLEDKKLYLGDRFNISLKDEDGRQLDFPDLSSGEKHLFLILSKIFIHRKEEFILMIDEPEISFGIPWQRKFITGVKTIIKDSNIKILLATHSVLILQDFSIDNDIISPEKFTKEENG